MDSRPAVVPCVFYKDPIAAMRWLEQAFGFETSVLLIDGEGRLGHAEMTFKGSPIEIGGEWEGPQLGGAKMRSPDSLGGAGTQFLRITLEAGIDEHAEHARAAGAKITQAPEDQFYGARTYRARDPEGHVWNFAQHVRDVSDADIAQGVSGKLLTSLEGVSS
jgi:uncharacterized glyoxalase superfamily protein PhnB